MSLLDDINNSFYRVSKGDVCLMDISYFITLFFYKRTALEERKAFIELNEWFVTQTDLLTHTYPPREDIDAPFTLEQHDKNQEFLYTHKPHEVIGWVDWQLENAYIPANAGTSSLALELHGIGDREDEKNIMGYVHVRFPLSWFDYNDGSLWEYFVRFCHLLNPYHGLGGVGFCLPFEPNLRDDTEELVYDLAHRYPILDITKLSIESLYLDNNRFDQGDAGIKGCNIFTVLNNEWLDKIGGKSHIKNQLKEGFQLDDYAGGLAIQAGPFPDPDNPFFQINYNEAARLKKKFLEEFGETDVAEEMEEEEDVEEDEILYDDYIHPSIQKLADIVKPIRKKALFNMQMGKPGVPYFNKEETKLWLARFDSKE